ncbi:fimbrial protein [Vogesella sp. LIG4]|uniref:fimbrial protein n=1 Tax=Vogesella sp. LIG4 TaxID=1192162 RepID=UPI00081F89A6|nr:fimbrial protein [Vogesella sp. LIG4]SCK16962.1 Pilin (type 1 fimbria component protein) [Vogesella sp. LIG4]
MNKISRKTAVLLAVIFFALPSLAQATCWFHNGWGQLNWSGINYPNIITPPRDSVASYGTPILDTGWQDPGTIYTTVDCSGSWYDWTWAVYNGFDYPLAPGYSGVANVYQTNVPGVGLIINYWNSVNSYPSGDVGRQIQTWANRSGWEVANASDYRLPARFRMRLIKYGPISPGVVNLAGIQARIYYGGGDAARPEGVLAIQLTLPHDVTVTPSTCSLAVPNTTVPLPTIGVNQLPAIGATTGAVPFKINMSCDLNLKVSFQIDGTPYSGMSSTSGVLAPNSGTASGVGLQLLSTLSNSAGLPVAFGTKTLLKSLTIANDQLSIPLIARYYRTGSTVSPGSISSTATLTMFYE